ncbi:MAG: alpha/beta hydrolase, partial [Eubacteriales bacterium]
MGRGIVKTLFAAAGILTALSGLAGFGFADFVMSGGKRQTLAEARKWQEDHYDISWYDSLQKEEYIVEGFGGYALHTVLCKNPMKSGKYVILTHGYSDNRFGSLKYMKIYLDRGYNCIIYDLRGHGENEKTWTSYGVREGRDLVCLIKDTRERYDDVR